MASCTAGGRYFLVQNEAVEDVEQIYVGAEAEAAGGIVAAAASWAATRRADAGIAEPHVQLSGTTTAPIRPAAAKPGGSAVGAGWIAAADIATAGVRSVGV